MEIFIRQFKFEIIVIICWNIASFMIGDVNLLFSSLCCLMFLLIADIESGKLGLVLQILLWLLGISGVIYTTVCDKI